MKLQPVRGRMAAFDALATAAVSLSRGSNPNKEIIILTDGQNIGWDVDNRARWDALVSSLDTLTTKPQVLLRKFPLPATFRNVAIAGISYSRDVIGTDRAVSIDVSVENTGTEAVTPGGVELKIGDKVLKDVGTGQLQPGARESVRFLHKFADPGSFVVTAKVKGNDDLALDDETVSVCNVVSRLGVLIVDGNPTERFMDRAGSFTALALSPNALADPSKPKEKKPVALDVEVMPLSRAGSVPYSRTTMSSSWPTWRNCRRAPRGDWRAGCRAAADCWCCRECRHSRISITTGVMPTAASCCRRG